jgi:hypothetical protein
MYDSQSLYKRLTTSDCVRDDVLVEKCTWKWLNKTETCYDLNVYIIVVETVLWLFALMRSLVRGGGELLTEKFCAFIIILKKTMAMLLCARGRQLNSNVSEENNASIFRSFYFKMYIFM